jgi:hypothetical protein
VETGSITTASATISELCFVKHLADRLATSKSHHVARCHNCVTAARGKFVANIRRRGKKWQVKIRRKGRTSLARSFQLKSDALAWAHQKELDAERLGLATEYKALRRVSVAEILVRYRDEVVPRKKRADRETISQRIPAPTAPGAMPLSMSA